MDRCLPWKGWAKTGKEVRTLPLPDSRSSALSPTGTTLALVDDEHVRLWDTGAGKETWKVAAPKGGTAYGRAWPTFSPDGKKLAVGGEKQVLICDSTSGESLAALDRTDVRALAFSPDGRWLAVAAYPSGLQLWDAASWKHVRDIKLGREGWFQGGLCFSPDSKTVAWTEGYHRIGTATVETGAVTARVEVSGVAGRVVFTANGRSLISAQQGYGIQLWDHALKRKASDLSKEWYRSPVLALSGDGKTLAAGDNWGICRQVRLWDLATRAELPPESGHERTLNLIGFSPDSKSTITGDQGRVCVWDTASGERRRRLEFQGHHSPVVAPDLGLSATIRLRSVALWELAQGKEAAELTYDGKDALRYCEFSPDGKYLVTAHNKCYPDYQATTPLGSDGLAIWDISRRKIVRRLPLEDGDFFAGLVVAPDGETAITPSAGGKVVIQGGGGSTEVKWEQGGPIHVWDMRAGGKAFTLEGHKGGAHQLAVSGDGRLLASAGHDRTVYLWELVAGASIFPLKFPGTVSLAVSRDGRLLAVAPHRQGRGHFIALVDLIDGKEVHRYEGFGTEVVSLTFSPDGRRLGSALQDGTALLWDLTVARQALRRAPTTFRPEDGPRLWDCLIGQDALKAHRAVWELIDAGDEAVRFLKERLRPVRPDRKRLQELVAALDSPKFRDREAALASLAELGEAAEPALREALLRGPTLEARRRIEPLLEYRRLLVNPSTLGRRRGIHVLEKIGTAAARELLRTLATGEPEVRSTREAARALKRLD